MRVRVRVYVYDIHLYFPYSLYCKQAIPYGVALRNCSKKHYLREIFGQYKKYLTRQNHAECLVESEFHRAFEVERRK